MNDLSKRDCTPCSNELNQYEFDIYTNLIAWLEQITCIPWIRAYPPAAQPQDETNINKIDQYGTLFIESLDEGVIELGTLIEEGLSEGCFLIKKQLFPRIKLSVFNYNNDCNLPNRSPLDILNAVRVLYEIPRINECLCEKEISILNWGVIANVIYNETGEVYYHSSRTVEFEINGYSSFSEILIDNIKIETDCCLDKEVQNAN